MEYDETIHWLFNLQRFGIKLGLHNITAILDEMGDPQHRLTSVIVGGTNGKGSTARYLEQVARESGVTTGIYTSPHLQRFNERIQVGGAMITDDEVVRQTGEIKAAADAINARRDEEERMAVTFFELTTVMAIRHFVEKGCALGVFEVGMGGRLDATNVLPAAVSVITSIGIEHTKYLGDTVEKIAFEKAGIIKPGAPAVTAERKQECLAVFAKAAGGRGAELHRIDEDFHASLHAGETLDYRGKALTIDGATLGIRGKYQGDNAACALFAWEKLAPGLGVAIDETAIRRGLKNASLPARLQTLRDDPPVVLDVSHNPDAVETLVQYVAEHVVAGGLRPVVLVGMMADKDAHGYLGRLATVATDWILTRSQSFEARPVYELAAEARKVGVEPDVTENVTEGMERLARRLDEPGRCGLIVGSFYVVGEALDYLDDHPEWPGPAS